LNREGLAAVAAVVAAVAVTAGACSNGTGRSAATGSTTTTLLTTTTTVAPGSTNSSTDTSGAAPPTTKAPSGGAASKAAFLAAANGLCKEASAKTKVIGEGVPSNPTGQDQAYALDKGDDVIAAAVAQMKRLDQPGGDRTKLILFYERSQQLVVLTHQLADAFRAGDQSKVTSIETKANALDDDLTHAADSYGLTACGSGSGP
jgi:hypothetical protein